MLASPCDPNELRNLQDVKTTKRLMRSPRLSDFALPKNTILGVIYLQLTGLGFMVQLFIQALRANWAHALELPAASRERAPKG